MLEEISYAINNWKSVMPGAVSATVLWTLVVVTTGGNVNQTSNFPNEEACRNAESLVNYGMTVKEKEISDQKWKERQEADAKKWREAHPPRPPRTAEEKELVAGRSMMGTTLGSSIPYVTAGSDGMIYEQPASEVTTRMTSPNDIKMTKCFPTK